MIYTTVQGFEKKVPQFNKEPFTSDGVISLAKDLDIGIVQEKTLTEPFTTIYKGKPLIFYNPHRHESRLILTLGHEIGHVVQGHLHYMTSMVSDIFVNKGLEKDAGIFGFLMWMPTIELCKMTRHGQLDIEDVYRFAKHFDPDMSDDMALKLCDSRIRIFKGFIRARMSRNQMTPKNNLSFKQRQMRL